MLTRRIQPPFRRPKLYAASLLQEARRLRLIEGALLNVADTEFTRLAHLFRKTRRTSLAESEQAVRYLVGLSLRALPSHAHALQALCDALEQPDLTPLLDRGSLLWRKRFLLAATRYAYVKQSMLPLQNLAYQRTFYEQIPSFLRRANAPQNAHKEEFSLSYPLCEPIRNVTGISRILRYLHGLYYENKFLAQFPYEELEYLYLSYCFSRRSYDIEAPIVNLYRMTFPNALFCAYLQKESPSLVLRKKEVQMAQDILLTLTEEEQAQILEQVANRLFDTPCPYYNRTSAAIRKTILAALRRRSIADVLVVED